MENAPKDMISVVKNMLDDQSRLDDVTQSVLELLAVTMFADKKVLASEIQAFVANVQWLQNDHVLKTSLSEGEIIKWYEANKGAMRALIQPGNFEAWMDLKVEELKDFPDKHLLLRAMDEIAHADGEKHISEKALEVLTAKKWAEALLKKYNRKWVA